jgi:hypothetical protein
MYTKIFIQHRVTKIMQCPDRRPTKTAAVSQIRSSPYYAMLRLAAVLLGASVASATGGPGTPGANQTIECVHRPGARTAALLQLHSVHLRLLAGAARRADCCLTRADTSEPAALAGRRYLLELTASSRPAWITAMDKDGDSPSGGAAFDCSWRKLAYSYAPRLQPVTTAKAKELFDALELEALCGETFDATTPRPHSSTPLAHATAGTTIYVSNEGSDGNEGTSIKEPVETLHGALFKARKLPCRKEKKRCDVSILLRAGTCTQPLPPAPRLARVPVHSLSLLIQSSCTPPPASTAPAPARSATASESPAAAAAAAPHVQTTSTPAARISSRTPTSSSHRSILASPLPPTTARRPSSRVRY